MLKYRIIPVLFLKHGWLVRSELFTDHRNIGNPVSQVDRYSSWNVDELIYIDITPDNSYDTKRDDLGGHAAQNPSSLLEIVRLVAAKCFMPLTVGGKIRSLDDILIRMANGADKVTINTKAIEDPEFIKKASGKFGSQAIVVSMDVRKVDKNKYEVFSHLGRKSTGLDPVEWASKVEKFGAGEIFLNSIDRDGTAEGYDLELVKMVSESTNIPVIACGGAATYGDFRKVLEVGGASAAAAGNIFNFKELAYPIVKNQLRKAGVNIR